MREAFRVCGDKLCPVDQNPPDLWVILGGDGSLGGRVGYSEAVGLKLTDSVERLHGLHKIWVSYKFVINSLGVL